MSLEGLSMNASSSANASIDSRARRATARTKVRGLVRIELGARVGGYRIGDLSFGGMRVIGRPAQIAPRIGYHVRVMLSGRRAGTAFDLDAVAEIRRIGEQDLGLCVGARQPDRRRAGRGIGSRRCRRHTKNTSSGG